MNFNIMQRYKTPALGRVVAGFLSMALLLGTVTITNAAPFTNPLGNIDLYGFLLNILNSVVFILFPVIVLMIVYVGFLFVAAQGNQQKLQEAKKAIVWTVIGSLVVLGSKALALAIRATVYNIEGSI